MTLWTNDMLIGIDEIDKQHHNLVRALDELLNACSHHRGEEYIRKTLFFAVDYTKVHFADEEKLQEEFAYPDRLEHKKLHKKFIDDLSKVVLDYKNGCSIHDLVEKTGQTLIDWIMNHIKTEDKKYSEHIKMKREQMK